MTGPGSAEAVPTRLAVTPSRDRQRGQLTSFTTWAELKPEPQRAHLII
jgi:hypothetical protein